MDRRAKLGVCPSFEHVTGTHNNMAALCVIVSFFLVPQIVIDIGTIL